MIPSGPPLFPLTSKGETLKSRMHIVMIAHISISVFKMFLISPMSVIGDVISILVL